ncbi:MAG TPA: hypothetical protein VFQ61_21645 [Polyangiaceae bacterium]|nr:hypothetical protein [Polyangiaceae bacterium]
MRRLQAISAMAALTTLGASACEALIGDVEVTRRPRQAMDTLQPNPAPVQGGLSFPPFPNGALPSTPAPGVGRPESDAGVTAPGITDAGGMAPDAAPPAPSARPILVDAPTQLELVGKVGGGPRLGTCQGGVVVGVRATANPSTETFGQRLAFIEPLCASATVGGAAITIRRDDALVNWSMSEPFLGVPSLEVPDTRLTWVPQPPAFCPDSAPVLVGLSGQYDPIAPDDTETSALRSLVIECAPLTLAANGVDLAISSSGHLLISQADNFSASGSEAYRSSCPEGAVVTQMQLHSGFWLDGFVLGCSALRAPRAKGEVCGEGRECSSGVCMGGICGG